MFLSYLCIKRPVFTIVLSLMLLSMGLIYFTKLQVRFIPNIDPPAITITSSYPGADALYMEREITLRIENSLRIIKDVDYFTSQSVDSSSSITVYFKLWANIDVALNDVRSQISSISKQFPTDMDLPAASKLTADNRPSIIIGVTTNSYNDLALTAIIQDYIVNSLSNLSTVGQAKIFGARNYTMLVEPDPVKLYQHNISPLEIEAAILAQNTSYPAGNIMTSSKNVSVTLDSSLSTPQEFQNIVLKSQSNSVLKLGDVANVYLGHIDDTLYLRTKNQRGMAVGIVMQTKASIIDLVRDVKAQLKIIKSSLPSGVDVAITYDTSLAITASIREVFLTLIEALALVALITYLFLASPIITIIPLVTIPLSLISTFTAMYFMGFSLNIFTLLAMILAIGLVVDDAIVVLENIFRHKQVDQSTALTAAQTAIGEIGFTVIAMTLTLATVFLPVGFIDGFVGKLFIEFAWTLAFCVLFSGFIALTLTPMMASRMLNHNTRTNFIIVTKFNDYLLIIQAKYLKALNWILEHEKQFFIYMSPTVIVLIMSFIFVNQTFVPNEDDGLIQVVFTGPEGTNLDHSQRAAAKAEKIYNSIPEINNYISIIGWQGNSDSAFSFLPLKDWRHRKKSQEQIRLELNKSLSKISDMSIFAVNPLSQINTNAQRAIEFNLQSNFLTLTELDKISLDFMAQMKNSGIFQQIDRDLKSSTPTVDILVNKDIAYRLGVDLATLGYTIQYLMAGKQIGDFRKDDDIYNVMLQYNIGKRSKISDINNIYIKSNTGEMLPLGVLASLNEHVGVKSYNHYNSIKAIAISADLNPKFKINEAINKIDEITRAITNKQSDIKLEYLGQIKSMFEAEGNILSTFLFALIFIYLILAAQFESFTDPLLILLAVPFSIVGAVFTLLIFNNSLNMYSNIGLITLVGLITKNSIMIVEFANQLHVQGLIVKEAIIKASIIRLRPILMTSLATIFGSIPLATASGAGAAARNSIGLVIIGGMSVGTLFTIFVIPSLYYIFKKQS